MPKVLRIITIFVLKFSMTRQILRNALFCSAPWREQLFYLLWLLSQQIMMLTTFPGHSLSRYIFFKFPVLTYNWFPTQREKEILFFKLLRFRLICESRQLFETLGLGMHHRTFTFWHFDTFTDQHILVHPVGSDICVPSGDHWAWRQVTESTGDNMIIVIW